MNRFIEQNSIQIYDIVVVGGGITGAAVAYEAASRGFSVALVDKGDFGAGTSSASSKLIHGGLRYFASREYGLVRESLRERRTLENIAPNLVYPIPFLVPVYSHGPRQKLLLKPGMILYDLLSYDKGFTWDPGKRLPLHRSVSREKVLELEPLVKPAGMTGAIVYYDCASLMPERLTLAFIRSAVKHGAVVANYAKVEAFIRESGRVTGVQVRDLLTDVIVPVRGKVIVNCGGPWADLLLGLAAGNPPQQQIRRSEGIHLITRLLNNTPGMALGGLTLSGRGCNLIPWRGHTLIGTTDREYDGHPDEYQLTRERIEEYIREVNGAFDHHRIHYSDVVAAYGGLRPLVGDSSAKTTRQTSRRYEVHDGEPDGLPGLITVEGGKFTTSRALAESVLKKVVRKLGARYKASVTARTHLAGCDIPDLNAFVAEAKSANSDFCASAVDYLARIYGTELDQVLAIARTDPQYAKPLNADGEMLAQVVYAIRHEMARTLKDILMRRTGLGTLGHPGAQALCDIAKLAAVELKWSQARADREFQTAEAALSLPQ